MNKFFSILLAVVFLFSAHSATALNMADAQRIVRLEGDINFPKTDFDIFSTSPGGNVLFALRLNFNKLFYLEPAVGIGGFYQKINNRINLNYKTDYDASLSYFGVTIPVYAGINIFKGPKFGMSIFTGPRLFVGSTSNVKGSVAYPASGTVSSVDKKTFSPGLEICWNAGCEFELKKFQLRAEYGFGLTETCHFWLPGIVDSTILKRRFVAVSFGYSF